MRIFVIALLAALLAGCASAPIQQKVVTVQVKVREPCIPVAPDRPNYVTGKGAYPGEKEAARALANDFESAEQYGRNWEAAAAGCLQ